MCGLGFVLILFPWNIIVVDVEKIGNHEDQTVAEVLAEKLKCEVIVIWLRFAMAILTTKLTCRSRAYRKSGRWSDLSADYFSFSTSFNFQDLSKSAGCCARDNLCNQCTD